MVATLLASVMPHVMHSTTNTSSAAVSALARMIQALRLRAASGIAVSGIAACRLASKMSSSSPPPPPPPPGTVSSASENRGAPLAFADAMCNLGACVRLQRNKLDDAKTEKDKKGTDGAWQAGRHYSFSVGGCAGLFPCENNGRTGLCAACSG